MPNSQLDALDIPVLPPALEKELTALGAESAERLLGVIRGLFHCINDLNLRVADLEKKFGESC